MPKRDNIHDVVKTAIIKNRWEITDDPYVISYGERFLFVDLGATEVVDDNVGSFIGAERAGVKIAIEIKEFRSPSAITDLEQAVGQYMVYKLLLNRVDPEREVYLAVSNKTYEEIFNEPIGELVISDLPLKLIVIDLERVEVKQWIPAKTIEKS